MSYLVDTNVILDIVTEDIIWFDWSSNNLAQCLDTDTVFINPIIYSEVSVGFNNIEDLEILLPPTVFKRAHLPYEAGFLAGKCFSKYRKSSGAKRSPLPDFYIGAHAAIQDLTLITRDKGRYRTYFPKLKIISPR